LASDEEAANTRGFVSTTRLEAFSDGVFAIAITLLVLDLALGSGDSALERVLRAWPSFLAYAVSFLTIGGAWLAHTALTDRLTRVDAIFLRLNLIVLLFVSFLPFPTRLVSEALHDVQSERVYVAMYGLTLLAIRIFGFVLDEYARRENLYAPDATLDALDDERRTVLPVVGGYILALAVGIVIPRAAVAAYALIGVYLVVPFREVWRLLVRRS
jgi:TMEM175 potassium channel family protein